MGSPDPVVGAPSPESPLTVADWGTVTVRPGAPIKLAFVAALSGEYAGLGIDEQRGVELAVEDMSQVKGFPVQVQVEDDGCNADRATAAARKIAADPQIVGVVGHLCSNASVPASTVYEQSRIVMISPSSTAPSLTARGLGVVNRVVWNDEIQARGAAAFARNTLGLTLAAALHDGNSFGLALAGAFQQEFTRLGGRMGSFEGISPGGQDYRPTLARIAAVRPDVIYFAGSIAEAGLVAAQLPEVGLGGVRLIGSDLIFGQAFAQQVAAIPIEVYATYAEAAANPPSPGQADFNQRYEARYQSRPSDVGAFHYQAYDAATLLLQKIDEVATVTASGELQIDRNALARAVRATATYPGLSGAITCNPTGDCGRARVILNVARTGRWEPAGP